MSLGFFMSGRRGTPFEGPNTVLFGVFGQSVVASWSAWSSGFSTSFQLISILCLCPFFHELVLVFNGLWFLTSVRLILHSLGFLAEGGAEYHGVSQFLLDWIFVSRLSGTSHFFTVSLLKCLLSYSLGSL